MPPESYTKDSLFLLAESGSSKCEWRLMNRTEVLSAWRSRGFNPRVQTFEEIAEQLRVEVLPNLKGAAPEAIHFYGPAMTSDADTSGMGNQLVSALGAASIEVNHDLLAAARSALQDKAGVVAILGTGSIACSYDGQHIVQRFGGHGYLFGDEGSGMDLGRRLLKGCLDADFPPALIQEVEARLQMPLADQVRDIFRAPRPNVVLASLAPLVRELSSFPEIKHMIERAFTDFIQKTLLRIPNVELQPIPFVGSVALNFSHELEHCLNREGLTAGTCDASPISRLVIYHQKHTST